MRKRSAKKRLDTELKTRQNALDKALKAHNEQLAALLAGKVEPAAVKVKK